MTKKENVKMYKCRIIEPDDIIQHPNADNLNLLQYNGLQFAVDKSYTVDSLYAMFFTDGQLSHEFCRKNNLYRNSELNEDTTKVGYMEDNRKVKAIRLRGEVSFGIVMSLKCFSYTGFSDFKQGMEFDELNGNKICNKFITKATAEKLSKATAQKTSGTEYYLEKHFDTENIRYYMKVLPKNSLCVVSIKIHGSSGRTGMVRVERKESNFVRKILGDIFHKDFSKTVQTYELVSGTRNTIVNGRADIINPEGSEHYRWEIHNSLEGFLRKGEVLYYEILRYDSHNQPIMNVQNTSSLKDKVFEKEYGKTITYNYGCGEGSNPMRDIYVYRITQEDVNGVNRELTHFEMVARCKDLGLKTVPVVEINYSEDQTEFVNYFLAKYLNNGKSILGNHLEEGYCFRFENQNGMTIYKAKNPYFLILEGVLKESNDYVDAEESS